MTRTSTTPVLATPQEISPAIVRALVADARRKGHPRGVIAVRGVPRWTAPEIVDVDGERARVTTAVSALAMRETMLRRDDGVWLVVVTDRANEDLGPSLCARLTGERVLVPDLWQAVQESFAARQIDPALPRTDRALAETLLAEAPPEGWPPARGGVLSRDAALEALVERTASLASDHIDPPGLLNWTLDPARVAGLERLPPTVREVVFGWLGERTGALGAAVVGIVRAGHAADALGLAVLAGLLADPAIAAVKAAEARGQLGHRYGGTAPTGTVAAGLADAARALLESPAGADPRLAAQLDRAEAMLGTIGAAGLAGWSAVLPGGFEARLRTYGRDLRAAIADPQLLGRVGDSFADVIGHLLAERSRHRVARASMALRLVRWLGEPPLDDPRTLAAAADRHVWDDAWVDRARAEVWNGDDDPHVAAAYRELYEVSSERRARHDEAFGRLLAGYTADDHGTGAPLLVERVLADAVVPLAKQAPLLLVVVDGMSAAIAAELAEGVAGDGWWEMLPGANRRRRSVLAALPTTTDVCRTSLLAGTLRRGGQNEEREGLAHLADAHGLAAALFHKADLERSEAGETLPERVRDAIGDLKVGIVAAVLNTVDDALDASDPGGARWGIDDIRHLRPLLQAARRTGRAVVLAADHGHVVERRDGELRSFSGVPTARWRPASTDGPGAGVGEVLLAGRRVLGGGGKVVAPWGERLRYGPLKAGYHGGASPAEAVTTLLTFCTSLPEGWRAAAPQEPAWWLGVVRPAVAAGEPEQEAAPAPERPEQQHLFERHGNLVDMLLASPTFAVQRERARRTPLDDDKVKTLIGALLGAGGRLPSERLATVADVPVYRISGTVTALQRLLNVDGYEVIRYDADGVTVVLETALLREQFDL